MKQFILFLGLLLSLSSVAQTPNLILKGKRTAIVNGLGSLAIVGSSIVAEGTSQTYSVVLTLPLGLTVDVSGTASLSATRGNVSGLTVSNASNTLRGDNKFTTLRATVAGVPGLSVSREVTFTDATTGYVSVPVRAVTVADTIANPQMRIGDFYAPGANSVNAGTGVYTLDLRTATGTAPTIAPGRTLWLEAASYDGFYWDAKNSRTTLANPITIRPIHGQVKFRNTFWLQSARGVRVTGEYDPATGAGDASYPGHRNGYAFTSGRYGIMMDNQYTDSTKSALFAAGGFEQLTFDFIEICGDYFAGSLFNDNNYDAPATVHLPYDNIHMHDMYVHDIDGEGCYWGSTGSGDKAHFRNSSFTNNRVLRVGNDGIQIGQADKGILVRNNVVHSNFNWRNPFQRYQDNALQLNIFQTGQTIEKNLFLRGGQLFINMLTQTHPDTVNFSSSASDTIVLRKNAFLYGLGGYMVYTNTQTISNVKKPITNLRMLFDGNIWGKHRYAANEVYTTADSPDQNYMARVDITGTNAAVQFRNNIYDGSNATKTQWFISGFASTSVTETGNTMAGTVAHPTFVNYMGLPDGYDYSRVEKWAGIVGGSSSQFAATGTRKGELITVPVGDLRTWHGKVYESKATGNTNIMPGVASGWATFWNVLYWDRATGQIVRNPSDLTGLSAVPPDDVRLTTGTYQTQGIGLLN